MGKVVDFDEEGLPIPQKVKVPKSSVQFDDEGLPVPIKKKEISSAGVKILYPGYATGGGNGSSKALLKQEKEDNRIADLLSTIKPSDAVVPKEQITSEHTSIIDDPVKHLLTPFRNNVKKASSELEKYGNHGRQAGESVKQANNGDRTQINAAADFQAKLKKDNDHAENQLVSVANTAYNTFMPNGKKAQEYLQEKFVQNNGELPKNNETVNLAIVKANRYEEIKKKVLSHPDLTQLAVDIARGDNPHLDKQIGVLEKEAGWDGGMNTSDEAMKQRIKESVQKQRGTGKYVYENLIPENQQGFYIDQLIHDPDIAVIAEENPGIKAQLEYLKNGGVYERYADYGENVARNMLSREYEQNMANIIANPIFNKSKYLDQLADKTFADNPALKKIADERLKGKWEGKIDTPGIVDEFGTGAKHTYQGMVGSFKDLIGAGDTEAERIYKGLEEQHGQVSSGVTGWRKEIGTAANFLGMMGAMATGGVPLKAAGLTPAAINAIVTAGTFYDTELNNWTMKYPGEQWKAQAGATLSTAAYAAVAKAFPHTKMADAIAGKMQPSIVEALLKLDEGVVSAEVRNNLVQKYANVLSETAKGTIEGTAHMVTVTAFQDALDRALGLDERESQGTDIMDVAKNMIIGGLFPQFIGAYGNRNAVGRGLNSIADYPTRHMNVLEKMKENGTITEAEFNKKAEDIAFLNKIKSEIPEGITDKNKGRFLVEALNEKHIKEAASKLPDANLTRQHTEQIRTAQEVKDRILNGEDVAAEEASTPTVQEGKGAKSVGFENAKEGDVVLYHGEKVTVGGKNKTNDGKDAIEVKKDDGSFWVVDKEHWDKDIKAVEQSLKETTKAETPTTNTGVEEGSVGVGREKSDADIEKRMAEIEGAKIGTPELSEFNTLEKEMEKRERATVFNVPLEKVNDAVDTLMNKEKEQPNGYGSFIEKRDARETKEVADRYLNAKELTDAELKKDFSDAVRGNPTTWYADGLKMREALKEATNRGIDTKDMLAEVTKVYEDAGYDTKTAKSVVANMLKPIFEGSQKVNEKQIAEQPLKETTKAETKTSNVGVEAGSVGVGGDVDSQYNARKKSIEDKLNQQLEDNKDRLDDIEDKGGTKTVRQKIYQEHTNEMVELEKWKMKEDLKNEDTPDGKIKKNSEFSTNQLADAIPNSEVHYENKEDNGVTTITLRDKNTKKHIASIDIGTGDTIDGYAGVRIQVNGEHQGKGLSKHLYNLALTEAKKQGLKGLYTIDEMLKTPDKTIATRDNFVTRKNTDEKLKTQARRKFTNVADPNITFIENVSDKFIKKGATKLSEQSLSKPSTPTVQEGKEEGSVEMNKELVDAFPNAIELNENGGIVERKTLNDKSEYGGMGAGILGYHEQYFDALKNNTNPKQLDADKLSFLRKKYEEGKIKSLVDVFLWGNKKGREILEKYEKDNTQKANEEGGGSNQSGKQQAEEIIPPVKPAVEEIEETGDNPPPGKPTTPEENAGGITHAAVAEARKKAGLPDYEGHTPVTHEERISKAREDIAANPSLPDETMKYVERGGRLTPQDNAVLAVYKKSLDAELESNPTKETYDKISRIAKVLDPEGTYAGQLLESRKLIDFNEDNLSNFLMGKETAQSAPLTDKQVKDETAKFVELKKERDQLAKDLAAEKEAHQKLIAEVGLNKAKAIAKKASKKTREEHIADRKAIVEKAREALKKIRQDQSLKSTIPGFAELKALAPHVKEFMQDLLNEGIDKFDNIVTDIHAEFKDVLDGLRKSDIVDILAGDYNEKKQTKNEKAAQLHLIKREAQLLKELAEARKGSESAKSETVRTEKNRRIAELEKKIKEVRQLNKDKEEAEPVEDKTAGNKTNDELDAAEQKRLLRQIEKLTDDLKNKNYAEEEKQQPVLKMSRKTILQKDKVIALENKIRIERAKDEYAKKSKFLKAWDKVMQVLGVKRIVQTAVDVSIPFRQGATLLGPRRFGTWVKSFGKMWQAIFNQKKYDRMMYDIRHSEDYHDMTKDGIVFNELESINPENRNEDFQKSFAYKIPIVREPLLASNRAADAFLNIARYELYEKLKANLERQGITRQSDPKAYEFVANWAMNMTGRGKMHSSLEKPEMRMVLGNTFYGARLMASRMNLLNPLTYFDPKIPKEVRYEAMKDMVSFIGTTLTVGYGLSQITGAKISLNPWDSDFLQLRYGNKVYDISGGLANYIRTGLRMIDAAKSKFDGSTKYEQKEKVQKAGMSSLNFFRNKLAPNTAYATDWFFGKANGQDFDASEIYKIYPMYADDVYKAMKEDGLISLATVLLPNLLGVGYGNYASRGQVDPDIDTLLERNMRSDELDKSTIHNYNDGGREINNKEFKTYIDKRDAEIKAGIEELYNKGKKIVGDDYKVKYKPYLDMTKDEVVKETNAIKSKATSKIKKELFGEKPDKTIQEEIKDEILDLDKLKKN